MFVCPLKESIYANKIKVKLCIFYLRLLQRENLYKNFQIFELKYRSIRLFDFIKGFNTVDLFILGCLLVSFRGRFP